MELRKRPVSVSDLQTSPHHEVSHRLSMPPGCDFDLLRTQLESKGHPRPNSVAIMGSINESIADSLDLSKQVNDTVTNVFTSMSIGTNQ